MTVTLLASLLLGGSAGWFGDRVACSLLQAPSTGRSRALAAVACGLAWAYGTWHWPSPEQLAWLAWMWVLVVLADTDLRQRVLPDVLTLPLVLAGLEFRTMAGNPLSAVFGLAGGAGLLAAIALIAHTLYREEVLGWGDVKLAAALGAWLGWPEVLAGVVIGFTAGGAVGTVVMVSRMWARAWRWRESYLPLGPFLILGAGASSVPGRLR